MINDKLEYNKKSIGKRCFVSVGKGFFGIIIDVRGTDYFIVKNDDGDIHEVSIFNIRYVESESSI